MFEFGIAGEASDRLIAYLESTYETPDRPLSFALGAILATIARSTARYLRDSEPNITLANRAADAFLMELRNAVKGFPAPAIAQRCPTMPQPAGPIALDENACETVDHTINSCTPSMRVMVLVTIAGSFIASADDIDAAHTIFAQALRRNLPSAGH